MNGKRNDLWYYTFYKRREVGPQAIKLHSIDLFDLKDMGQNTIGPPKKVIPKVRPNFQLHTKQKKMNNI